VQVPLPRKNPPTAIFAATTVWPELTTVRQPIAAMAGADMDLLLRSIRQRKDGDARVVSDHGHGPCPDQARFRAAPCKG